MIKQGSIYMLKAEGTPRKHPCVLLGTLGEEYVLLMFTSFKKKENDEWESYWTKKNKSKCNLALNDFPINILITTSIDKDEEVELDSTDGFIWWSQTNLKTFYFIDKCKLEKLKLKGSLKQSGWNKIIDKYKILNNRYCPYKHMYLLSEEREIRNWIENISYFSYEMKLI